jgi:hypothetical protein
MIAKGSRGCGTNLLSTYIVKYIRGIQAAELKVFYV